ncbi:MAG: hypothetical protein F4Y44_04060 [Chloroflexi bacterium]|nr:hypothetical protein [Chloroflexota bacterium]
MGTFSVEMGIGAPQGLRYEYVEALVDSGPTYNILPASMLRRLSVEVWRNGTFGLADGRSIRRDLGQTRIRLNGEESIAPVIFGDEGVQPLLGAVTLEIFQLGIDPVGKRLIPVDGLMMSATPEISNQK